MFEPPVVPGEVPVICKCLPRISTVVPPPSQRVHPSGILASVPSHIPIIYEGIVAAEEF